VDEHPGLRRVRVVEHADVDLALRALDADERQLAGVPVEDFDDLAGDSETHGQFLQSRPS